MDRLNLTNLTIVTIDGEDAKDLDDAISLEKLHDGFRLGVHIADVAHYVTENSPLDERAKELGTSTYLTNEVIPMLDEKHSNDLCSLKPGIDKLTLSCIMEVDNKGEVTNYDIIHTIINSKKKMTYEAVDLVLKGEKVYGYKNYTELLFTMKELAAILGKRRYVRGALDFAIPEAKIIMKRGKPVDIEVKNKTVATNIIEEFMLLANEVVAEHFFWLELPFVYRNHSKPKAEKLKSLNEFIKPLGYSVRGKHGKSYQVFLDKIKDKNEENLIKPILLRTMSRAEYSEKALGHFGLAAKYYTHFTSPIRRYPDLLIHRIIKEYLAGTLIESRVEHYNNILPELTLNCSVLERKAEELERADLKEKKAVYMQDFIGNRFIGTISFAFGKKGLFVQLDNTVEGFVPINKFPGEYIYIRESYLYINKTTKQTLSLGDRVVIEVLKIFDDKIDFRLIKKVEGASRKVKKSKNVKRYQNNIRKQKSHP
ncbi:MAG: VacB/RNase II family 3'-5' exoribonuclease [Defluviitaleaceae bacterium]|nr:VacB/RNase II family 3'-5' exoribonuclease [Defluviitaleaceae bacterium]